MSRLLDNWKHNQAKLLVTNYLKKIRPSLLIPAVRSRKLTFAQLD